MHAPRKEKWQEKLKRSRYLVGAILFHLILFLMIATLVIWPPPSPPAVYKFAPVAIQPPPPPPPPPPPRSSQTSGNPALNPLMANPAPPPSLITTQSSSAFQVNSAPTLNQTLGLRPSLSNSPGGPGGPGGPGDGPGPVAVELKKQLSKLLFKLPCDDQGNCALIDTHHFIMDLSDKQVHTCKMQVRGIVELARYDGGSAITTYLVKGGTPNTGGFNIYKLTVSDPPQTYYLNAGAYRVKGIYVLNYTMHIEVKDGSRVTLYADSLDGRERPNLQNASVPDNIPDHPIALKQPYKGEFIQVDTLAVDE